MADTIDKPDQIFIGPLLKQPESSLTLSDQIIRDLAAVNDPPYQLDRSDLFHLSGPAQTLLLSGVADYVSKRFRTNYIEALDASFREKVVAATASIQLVMPNPKESVVNEPNRNEVKKSWQSNKSTLLLGYGHITIKMKDSFSYRNKDHGTLAFTWQTPSSISERLLFGFGLGFDYLSFFVRNNESKNLAYADQFELSLSGLISYRYHIFDFMDGFFTFSAGAMVGVAGYDLSERGHQLRNLHTTCEELPADNIVRVGGVGRLPWTNEQPTVVRDRHGNVSYIPPKQNEIDSLGDIRVNPQVGRVARCRIAEDIPLVAQLGYHYAGMAGFDIGGFILGAQYKESTAFRGFGPLKEWNPDKINSTLFTLGWVYQN